MKSWYGPVGYYGLWILFLAWMWALYGWIGARCVGRWQPNRKEFLQAGLVCLLLTVIALSIPAYLRILSDEAQLTCISRSMFYDKRADLVLETQWIYDHTYALVRQYSHKSILFPFLIHLVHLVLGYRTENVFVLNSLVLFALLAMIYFILTRMGGVKRLAAYAGIIMVVAQPVVLMYSRSGGYDLFFVVIMTTNFLILKEYLDSPSPAAFRVLWTSLLLLAIARPEAVIFFIITLALLATARKIRWSYLVDPCIVLPLPWALAIIVWQRTLVSKFMPGFFQNQPGVKAYSADHFFQNSVDFLKGLLNFQFYYPFASIVNLIGVLFIAYYAIYKWKCFAKLESARQTLLIITVMNVLALWIIYTGLHLGGAHVRISQRYYMLFVVILSAFTVFAMDRTPFFRRRPLLILLSAIFMYGLYYPVAYTNPSHRGHSLTRINQISHKFFKKVEDSKFLVVSIRPNHFVIDNYATMSFKRANRDVASLLYHLETGRYSNIYVVQEIKIPNMEPLPRESLNSKYLLETLFEEQTKNDLILRISRVIKPPHRAKKVKS